MRGSERSKEGERRVNGGGGADEVIGIVFICGIFIIIILRTVYVVHDIVVVLFSPFPLTINYKFFKITAVRFPYFNTTCAQRTYTRA